MLLHGLRWVMLYRLLCLGCILVASASFWRPGDSILAAQLGESAPDDQPTPPYAQSTYAASLDLANRCGQVVGQPHVGDQWAMAWHTDGNTYAFWGDGGGFNNNQSSYGLARLSGAGPPCAGVTGTNVFVGSTQLGPMIGNKIIGLVSDGGTTLRGFMGVGGNELALTPVSSTNNGATWLGLITDSFDEAPVGPPPTNWLTARNAGHQVTGNQLVPVDAGINESVWNGGTISSDQAVLFDVPTLPGDGNFVKVGLRTDGAGHGYYISCNQVAGANNDQISIQYRDNVTRTIVIGQVFNLNADFSPPFTCGGFVFGDIIYARGWNSVDPNNPSQWTFGPVSGGNRFASGQPSIVTQGNPVVDDFQAISLSKVVMTLPDSVLADMGTLQPSGAGYTGFPSFVDSSYFYYYYQSANANTDFFPSSATTDIYLCRAPRASWDDKSTYTCVTSIDGLNVPTWGAFGSKISVFHDATGYVFLQGITYNAGIGRFIAAEVSGAGQNILGIFDAPTPWGPWTTLYYSPVFIDGSELVNAQFAAQYTSSDGLTMYLAYSGFHYYNLNFVKLTLTGGPSGLPPGPTSDQHDSH